MTADPTAYPDVNAVLAELSASVQTVLGHHFVGMYLYGSLALGDFNPRSSDIDCRARKLVGQAAAALIVGADTAAVVGDRDFQLIGDSHLNR